MMGILQIIFECINALLHIYIGCIFFSAFWSKKNNKLFRLLIVLICAGTLTISLLFLKGTLLIYIPMVIITLTISSIFEGKLINRVLCAILYLVITGATEIFIGFFLSVLFGISINSITNYTIYHISGMFISKFVTFLIILFIRVKKHNTLLKQYKKKYFSVFLFPLSTLAIAFLQCKVFIDYPNQDMFTKYWALVSYAALVIANIIVFDMIDSMYENTLNETKLITANEIITSQTTQYQALIDHNQKIMQLKHDHKNFCIGLRAKLSSGNIEAALEILNREYDMNNTEVAQGNVIHTIVNAKKQLDVDKNIEFNFEYSNLDCIKVEPTDLGIIIGNALDNAVDACEMLPDSVKRYINIFISIMNKKIYINIENPVIENLDTHKLISTKNDKKAPHGFGIISMKQIASKYNGEVLFSCDDKIFRTVIVMDNPTTR